MLKSILTRKYIGGIALLTQVTIAKKNANTILGGIWGLIQPFLHITVISFFMSFLLRFEPSVIVLNLVGALPFWTFINMGLVSAAESMKNNGDVLKRVLLPKTFFSISEILSNIYTLLYSFIAMYFAMILFFPEAFTWKIIFIPILSMPLMISIIAGGVVVSYATPYIRDIPQFLNVILGVLYWSVPIIYPYSLVPDSKKIFFEFNPIYILIKPMQDLVITQELPGLFLVFKSWSVCFLVLIISYYIYKKLARNVIYYL